MYRGMAVVVMAVGFAVVVTGTGAAFRGGRTVASGHWSGGGWTLTASDASDGRYCIKFTVRSQVYGNGCGSLDRPRGIGVLFHPGVPLPDFVAGAVVGRASVVEITLSNGATVRTPAIAPPIGLASNIRFYATQIPCPTQPRAWVARNPAGQIVAHYTIGPPRRMPGHLSC